MKQITIGKNDEGRRVDTMLQKLLPSAGKAFIYKMLRKKNIVLNGKRAEGSERISEGDVITLFLSEETIAKFESIGGENKDNHEIPDLRSGDGPGKREDRGKRTDKNSKKTGRGSEISFDIRKAIVYEDEDVIIINKPAGILSQKAGKDDVSVNEYLLEYCLQTGKVNKEELATFRPAVCNRLDRNTSGLIAAGVSIRGLRELSRLIRERKLEKYYRCVVFGRVESGGHLISFLKKDGRTNKVEVRNRPFEGADRVELEYSVIGKTEIPGITEELTELEIRLITGKSHQIRAQMASIGYPLAGDIKYGADGRRESLRANENRQVLPGGQVLCACRLVFPDDTVLENLKGREFKS